MKSIVNKLSIFILAFSLIFGFYLSVTMDVGTSSFYLHMRRFLLAAFVCLVPYYFVPNFSLRRFIPEAIIALLWIITSPLICYIHAINVNGGTPSLPYDIALGAYLFCCLCLVKTFIVKYQFNKVGGAIYSLLQVALIAVPVFNWGYFSIFGAPISSNGTMVIYQTNLSETMEYITSLGAVQWLMAFCVFVLLVILVKYNCSASDFIGSCKFSKYKTVALVIVTGVTGYYSLFSLLPRTHVISLFRATDHYFASVKQYQEYHDKIFDSLKVSLNNPSDAKGTIVLVIGESATRNYMKAFNETNDETTPWLSSVKDNKDFFLVKNSYSCAWNTVPALEHALTEANYYNDKEFNKSASIVDIARKSGYKTYWFSNQGKIGFHDTPITLVAETSDVSRFDSYSPYDEGLLPHLKLVNGNENNFVVLHIMGSHIDYNNRYPKEYQIWTDPDHTGRVADYKNSLVYTDKFLKDVFEYSKEHLNLKAFIYFSDHGTDPNRTRDPDETRFIGLRVPMFVYLSPEYQVNHSEVVLGLKGNKEQFFSNDLAYDLMCGIFDIKSANYDEKNSLTSKNYQYNRENLKAGLGTKFAKDDPYL